MSEREANDQRQTEASDPASSQQRLETLSADPHLRISVAGNPATPAHVLEILANDQEEQVREKVAGNPNTPWPLLEHLAWEFPYAFLHNPVGPLQLLAHPEQISSDELFWEALLREPAVPSWWWNWLRSHPTLSLSPTLRLHIHSAGETTYLYGVCQPGEERILLTLVNLLTVACTQRTVLPPLAGQLVVGGEQIVKEHLQWLAHSAASEVRLGVARNKQTPAEILRILAQDAAPLVRREVARNEQTPPEVLQTLARDQDSRLRRAVALNGQTPAEILRTLAQDARISVRQEVARNGQTPAEVLRSLAQDTEALVRRAVAGNRQTPAEVLRSLAQDADTEVRWDIALNRQTPAEVLHILAQDADAEVRDYVASNPQTPAEILRTLAQDTWEQMRQSVALNGQTPAEILRILAQDTEAQVRRAVALSLQTPTEVLRILAQDTEAQVRQSVAGNWQAPAGVLQTLAQDADAEVRWLANITLRLSGECGQIMGSIKWRDYLDLLFIRSQPVNQQVEQIGSLETPEPIRQIILTALAADWDLSRVNTAAMVGTPSGEPLWERILAPFMPPIALQKFASSASWQVRYLVALHEHTPWKARQRLCQDGNRYVRALARAKVAQITAQETD